MASTGTDIFLIKLHVLWPQQALMILNFISWPQQALNIFLLNFISWPPQALNFSC